MFRPIKNLLNYIQKNATVAGNIFGTGNAVKGDSEERSTNTTTLVINKEVAEETIMEEFIDESMNESMEMTRDVCIDLTAEDDIEDHIKSSVMLKTPIKHLNCYKNIIKNTNGDKLIVTSQIHDHNQNHQLNNIDKDDVVHEVDDDDDDDDDFDTFRIGLEATPYITENNFSANSDVHLDDLNAEEFISEDPQLCDSPFHSPQKIKEFLNPEVIVLNDLEIVSISSDVPSEDPLAIEDFLDNSLRDMQNPLDTSSSTNEDISTTDDLLWLQIESIKSDSINVLPNLSVDARSNKPKRIDTNDTPNILENTSSSTTSSRILSNEEQTEELRSDGSDSGFGGETLLQINGQNSIDSKQICNTSTEINDEFTANKIEEATTPIVVAKNPLRSNLKRRLEDSLDSASILERALQKKPKRSVNFEGVKVYYFSRQQGFGCVPSAGGCTLGMSAHHSSFKSLTLAEHAAELRRAHRLQLQESNPRGSSSDDSEDSEDDYLSEGSGSDLDAESNGFLQPVSPKQRRALLKAAGVRKIDANEKAECRNIRNSREVCGCTCRDFCDPDTCSCSLAGIKCQVDRAMFPCACTRDACSNVVGRIEFNPARVRTHFIHTIMRLEMENRQQQNPNLCGNGNLSYGITEGSTNSQSNVTEETGSNSLTSNFYNVQGQSNYSSGYASPAYNTDQNVNYYQQTGVLYSDVTTPELHASAQYQLDSLDSSLFSGANNATPSYGELMPAYGNVSSTNNSSTYHGIGYTNVNGSIAEQVSAYSSYNPAPSNYLTDSHNGTPTAYSSCAVPSVPPYGTATTTANSIQYHNTETISVNTTGRSCIGLEGDESSFINLSTPISSSSRLSQINDLLQHNRNTTATLVSVLQSPSASGNIELSSASAAATASINTPPIEDARKSCLAFEELSPPLNPTPIVAVIEHGTSLTSIKSLRNETTSSSTTSISSLTNSDIDVVSMKP